jgi:hypothetical protein
MDPSQRKKKVRKTTEIVKGFHFVICVKGLSRVNTGKDDDGTLKEK